MCQESYENRKWIFSFIEKKFNCNSYLNFTYITTENNYKVRGKYDYTLSENGYIPRKYGIENKNFFDKKYYNNLSQSKFCLCPSGDMMYSMRFYECLMCKCIPIVDKVEETYRSKKESKLDYKYYLSSEKEFIYREDWVEHNYNIFLQYHTLEYFYNTIHVFGMRRSRTHLICNVIRNNYKEHNFYNNFGGSINIEHSTPWRKTQKSEGDNIFDIVIDYYEKEKIEKSILLFEDKLYKIENDKKTINIIIIRDIYDVITSRSSMKYKEWIIDEIFIDTYKKILKEVLNIDNNIENKLIVDTDKFIKDKIYRDKIILKLNIKNYIYSKDNIPKFGGGKTFKNPKNRENVKISLKSYNLIKKDIDFQNLINKYYNYCILEKLKNNL